MRSDADDNDTSHALATQPSGVQLVVETQVVQHPAPTMNLNRAPMPVTRLALGIAVIAFGSVHSH